VSLLMQSVLVGTLNVAEKLRETAALLLRCVCNAGTLLYYYIVIFVCVLCFRFFLLLHFLVSFFFRAFLSFSAFYFSRARGEA
jgi:hypothetical protein